jgi:hypothetical protein
MMMGITMPDSGRVELFGKPFDRGSLDRVGYLPEERGLYKKMNVLDQLVFFGRLHGLTAAEANKRSIDWAKRMEIADALDKKTQELSKGMQQKIQFIATLLHDPGLVVMDEPFSGLDPVNATLLQDALLELKSAEVAGKSDFVFDAPHGPGGEALRFNLPDQWRRGCTFRQDARDQEPVPPRPGGGGVRRQRRVSEERRDCGGHQLLRSRRNQAEAARRLAEAAAPGCFDGNDLPV